MDKVIHLVGPGGAGKSTVGSALASRLDLLFIDLDLEFMEHIGDISHHIDHRGYHSYASENVRLCLSIMARPRHGVIALSSGFMAYPESVHPAYPALRSDICTSPTTFVLLPSFDLEACVDEIVRRQVARPIGRPNLFTALMTVAARSKSETLRFSDRRLGDFASKSTVELVLLLLRLILLKSPVDRRGWTRPRG